MGNKIISYIIKNKNIIEEINKKSQYFQDNLNNFILKNNLDIKVYRYSSIIRIVYTKKKYKIDYKEIFLKIKFQKINFLRKYLLDNGIYYPSSGIIFFHFQQVINQLIT